MSSRLVVFAALAGFFVVVGAAIPTPLARMHPPGMDVTKPEKPHYVLLRRKPEVDQNLVLDFLFFWRPHGMDPRNPPNSPPLYPWSARRVTLTATAEAQRQ